MSTFQLQCPKCNGEIIVNLGSMLADSAHSRYKFKVECQHCSYTFPLGYASKFKKIEDEAEVTSTQPTDDASGAGFELGRSPSPTTSNDHRSNSMNPNNPSFQAANDNRSNQMNPNNSAYRSSRG